MRRGLALVTVTAAVLAVPSGALGAGISPASKKVAGATATVSSCGSLSAMTFSWTVVSDTITSVALGSIPAACNGAKISLTLANSSNTSIGAAGPVTISGTSQTLSSVTGSPTGATVAHVYVSVVGP